MIHIKFISRLKVLIFFSLLLFCADLFCQDEVIFDSQKKYSQKYVDSMRNRGLKKEELYDFRKILESNKDLYGWTFYYKRLSYYAYQNVKNDSVLYYSNKAIEIYNNSLEKRPLDEKDLITHYLNIAAAQRRMQQYENSITNFKNALELADRHQYKYTSYIYAGIAGNHISIGNDSIALNYYQKVSKDTFYMKLGDNRQAAITYNNMAVIYDKWGDLSKAKKFMKLVESISDKSSNESLKKNMTTHFGSLGELYFQEKKIDSAMYYFKKANKNFSKYGVYIDSIEELSNINYKSFINIHSGKVNRAISDLNHVVDEINKLNVLDRNHKKLMLSSLQYLALAYDKKGSSKESEKLVNLTTQYLEDFYEKEMDNKLVDLEVEFQTKEKENEIAQLTESKKQQNKIIGQQRIIAIGLGFLLLTFLILAYFIWRQRKLKTQYEKENLEQRLLRSQMNPHFVYNALNSICSLVDKKSSSTIPYINKLATLFRFILTNSREEFVPIDDEILTLKNYLELQSNFTSDFNFKIDVNDNIDTEEWLIPPMLIQPFVENSIVHGFKEKNDKGNINIEFKKTDEKNALLCVISDDGTGSETKDQNHKSLSSNIVNERLAIFQKKFKFKFDFERVISDKGTTVNLFVPYLIDA